MLRPAPYSLTDAVNAGFQIFWAVVVFVIALMILRFFASLARKPGRSSPTKPSTTG